jgi:predicted metal-dependent hydrolase
VKPSCDAKIDANYAAFFDCFNRGQFYEAHGVLEKLWRAENGGPNSAFYQGLIQLAGAFVHLQKGRRGPTAALLRRARENLAQYPSPHLRLNVVGVCRMAEHWLRKLESPGFDGDRIKPGRDPECHLESQATSQGMGGTVC